MSRQASRLPTSASLLFLVFLVSGFSGLIYQSIWSHYLRLFLGHAAHGQTVVLVVFVGGMALGSLLVGQRAEKLARPLVAYAAVEAAIGLFALGFHDLYVALTEWTFTALMPAVCDAEGLCVVQWAMAVALILPQSILLGATFPLMAAGVLRIAPETPGSHISVLYFVNSFGAVLGVLCSGFVLIPALGLPGTQLVAGVGNFAVAAGAWLIGRGGRHDVLRLDAADDAPAEAGALAREQRMLLLIAGLTGLSSFIYEIAWVRLLGMVLGASTQAFEVMLAAFILGLALGGLLVARRVDAVRDTLRLLAIVQLAMGSLAALTIAEGNLAFDWNQWVVDALGRSEAAATAYSLTSTAIAMAMMLPTTLCAGMTLPLITYRLLRLRSGERAIGAVYGVNTLGGIAGVLLAVHLLLPLLDIDGALLVAASIDVGLGLWLLLRRAHLDRPARALAVVAGLLLLAAIGGLRVDPVRAASGVYSGRGARVPAAADIIYARDGKTATIHVIRYPGEQVAIATNGKSDGAISLAEWAPPRKDESTMSLLGALPLLLRPEAETMALIGWGTGLSTATALASPHLERVDTIEIEPAMVEGARVFMPMTAAAYEDPRSHVVYDDAKSYFARSHRRYDLIVAEPSNPWISGVASLFSREFYATLRRYLTDDGVLVQWVQTYDCSLEVAASILAAVRESFPRFELYEATSGDLLIVAPRDPAAGLDLAPDAIARAGLAARLGRIRVDSIEDVRLRKLGDDRSHGRLAAAYGVPANSDFEPFVEQQAPRARLRRDTAKDLGDVVSAPVPVAELLLGLAPPAPGVAYGRATTSSKIGERVQALAALRALTTPAEATPTAAAPTDAPPLEPELAAAIALARLGLLRCPAPPLRDETPLLMAANRVARAVNAALAREQVGPVWRRIEAQPCHAGRSERLRGWIGLHRAVAERDLPQMARLGRTLLAADPAAPREAVEVALGAAMLAEVAAGRSDAARALLESAVTRLGREALRSPLWLGLATWPTQRPKP